MSREIENLNARRPAPNLRKTPLTITTAQSEGLFFLNRDQIVLATLQQNNLVLTTTIGARVLISGSPETLTGLIDQLVNAIGSNYIAIPDSARTTWQHPTCPERSRFVDEGLSFITITK
jgi:hypothetical protein